MLERLAAYVGERYAFCLALTLLLSVVLPWLAFLGGYPAIDEGCYLYMAQGYYDAMLAGKPFPPLQGFSFYSFIFCWLFALPGNPFFWFRAVDLVLAIIVGALFCDTLKRESGKPLFALVLGGVFLCALALPVVKDSGFKNPINPSWICLFLALRLVCAAKDPSSRKWFFAGVLTALAILFRETFAPYAILGFVAAWIGRRFSAALSYAFGGLLCALLFVAAICLYDPQNLTNIINGYLARGVSYGEEAGRVWDNFRQYGDISLTLFRGPMFLLLAAIALACAWRLSCSAKRVLFWICAVAIPLYEPMVKIGFVYHFACCLPGLACLAAVLVKSWRPRWRGESRPRKLAVAFLCVSLFLAFYYVIKNYPTYRDFRQSFAALAGGLDGGWPRDQISQSHILRAAKSVKEALPPGGSLSMSGFIYPIYGASGAKAPRKGPIDPVDVYEMADLSRLYQLLGKDKAKFARAVAANPPDVVAAGYANGSHEASFLDEISSVLLANGYVQTDDVTPAPQRKQGRAHNDWLGVKIFKRVGSGESSANFNSSK